MGFAFNAKYKTAPKEVFQWKLFWIIFVASTGSITFAYDLAFIGGVFSLPAFINRFHITAADSGPIQAHAVNIFQGGAFFGVILIYWFNESFGRRRALVLSAMVFNIGVIIQMVSRGNIGVFYFGRVISGLGVGGISFAVPQYLSECAPPEVRGGCVGCFEIGMQVGTIIGFWINYGVQQNVGFASVPFVVMIPDDAGDRQWFIPIAFQFIPPTLMSIGLMFLCESPRWYYLRHRKSDSVKALVWLRNLPEDHPYLVRELADYERQMEHELSIATASGFRAIIKETFTKKMAPRLVHGCLLMIFQNSTGINAMNNFSVTFFKVLGFQSTSVKLFSTGIYGIVKGVGATITFLFLVDRFGRRPLVFVGSVLSAFSMFYVAAYSSVTHSFTTTQQPNAASNSAVAFIYIFGLGYAIGWNLPWIIAAEIFPTRIRSFCLVMTTCSHWIGEFYTAYAVTYMFKSITYGTFLFFGCMTVLGGIYMYVFVPETRGVPLENMDILFEAPGLALQQMKYYQAFIDSQQSLEDYKAGENGTASIMGVETSADTIPMDKVATKSAV
ncbi:quinate permease [Niveomyces insectorum RCEF 264]|uniref:Quinate transporter n=1 Tax=Niveomyces insectorum RCEF 264 TaxID=1081102 RepID=A0A167T9B3_9HYPO|nr:quinate permease [Niveomyces insectorum RCEF 264]